MELKITSSQDWPEIEDYVRKHLNRLSKSNEGYKITRNFNDDIKELARLEWEERTYKQPSTRRVKLVDKINQELLELDKLFVLGTLFK